MRDAALLAGFAFVNVDHGKILSMARMSANEIAITHRAQTQLFAN